MKLTDIAEDIGYPEVNVKDAAIRILDVEFGAQDDATHKVIWSYEVAAPEVAMDKDNNAVSVAGLTFRQWDFLPKSGLDKKGKNHWKWGKLKSLAKKLGISISDLDTDTVGADFFAKFKGRAFKVVYFKGERVPKKVKGQPVVDETTGEPKTIVEYTFGDVIEAASKYNA